MTIQLALDIRLREDATFSDYVGPAAARMASMTGLLYLWGRPESGRSHLLQARCHEATVEGREAIYLPAPAAHQPDILRDLELVGTVCVDDVDSVLGDDQWEAALFHLINGALAQGGFLCLCGASPASQLKVNLPDLASRLRGAMSLETNPLTDDEKLAVLQARARGRGFDLPLEVGRYIMDRSPRGMQNLISLLERLDAATLARQRRVTIPLAREALEL
jgi:DnaA-homolog protein